MQTKCQLPDGCCSMCNELSLMTNWRNHSTCRITYPARRVHPVNSNAPNICAVTVANFDGRLRTKQRHREKDYEIGCNPRDTEGQRLRRKAVVFLCELDGGDYEDQSGAGNYEKRDNDSAESRLVMYEHGSVSWSRSVSVLCRRQRLWLQAGRSISGN